MTFEFRALSFLVFFGSSLASSQPVNEWVHTNRLTGGEVRSLLTHPAGPMFAGVSRSGVFRSIDGGATWNEVLLTGGANSLAVTSSGDIFADGYRSTDLGDTWTLVLSEAVQSLAIDPGGAVFVGTWGKGVFRSIDNGNSWTQQNKGLTDPAVHAVASNRIGDIFAGTQTSGVFRSNDGGASWVQVGLGSIQVFSIAVTSSGQLFAATTGGIYRSQDDGTNWSLLPTVGWAWRVTARANGQLYAGTFSSGIFRSSDNGDSWTPINKGLTNPDVWAFAFDSSGILFAGSRGGGVFRSSDDGVSWTPSNIGLIGARVDALAFTPEGALLAGSASEGHFGNGIFRSFDGGESWTQLNIGSTNPAVRALAMNTSGHIFAGTSQSGVLRSLDRGASWMPLGIPNNTVTSLAINPNGDIFAALSFGGVHRSIDNGNSWVPMNVGPTHAEVTSLAVNVFGHVFAGTAGDGAFRSTDHGNTWTAVNNGLTRYVSTLAPSPAGDIFAGAGAGGGVFRSTDNGASWTRVHAGSADRALVVDTDGAIYIASTAGISRSTDNGASWIPLMITGWFTSSRSLTVGPRGLPISGTDGHGVSVLAPSTPASTPPVIASATIPKTAMTVGDGETLTFGANNGAPPTLNTGDIVILGQQTWGNPLDGGSNFDEFSWVPLVDLTAGQVIYFTDTGYFTTYVGGVDRFNTTGSNRDSLISYTVPSGGVPAGTVQTVTDNEETTPPYSVITQAAGGGLYAATATDMDFRPTGDQMLAFTSDDLVSSTPQDPLGPTYFTPLFGLDLDSNNYFATFVADHTTTLYPGLTDAVNAVAVGVAPGIEVDNARYVGPSNGTPAQILAAVARRSNWETLDAAVPTAGGGWTANGITNFTFIPYIPPAVTGVTVPNATTKVGDVVTATITVTPNSDDYTTASGGISGTIGGFPILGSSFTRIDSTTYRATITVIEGGADVPAGADIPVDVTITDSSGTPGAAFTTPISQTGDAIDANSPTFTISAPSTTGTMTGPVDFTVTYIGAAAITLGNADVTLNKVGTATGTLAVSGSGPALRTVTISGITAEGTLGISVAPGTAIDAAGNTITISGTSPTFTVNNGAAPALMTGDIVILGQQTFGNLADGGSNFDEFSWVPLVDLFAGQVIYFTDTGYFTTYVGGVNRFNTTGSNRDSLIRYTVPSGGVVAGTVQTVTDTAETTAPYAVITQAAGGGLYAATATDMDFRPTGDQLLAFTSADLVSSTPQDPLGPTYFTPLFGLDLDSNNFFATSVAVHTTTLYPGLTHAVNAVAVGVAPGIEVDNARYVGPSNGTRAEILAAVALSTNWETLNNAVPTTGGGWTANGITNFTLTAQAPIGLAAQYPGDIGIEAHPDVIFADRFETYTQVTDLQQNWDTVRRINNLRVATEPENVFGGSQALELTVPQSNSELSNTIQKDLAQTRDVLYLRYYSKFRPPHDVLGSSHNGAIISAGYYVNGVATPAVPANGTNKFLVNLENRRIDPQTGAPGKLNIYIYHPEQRTQFGDHFFPTGTVIPFSNQSYDFGPSFLGRPDIVPALDQWYSYEYMVRANTPGQRDGQVTVWLDGVLVADFPNLRLRDISSLKIDRFGLSFHIGSNPNGEARKWVDNVVVATSYIGPVQVPAP